MGKLGDTLRERRVALGITIEQAESHTKMRARLLNALEEGDYERLPDPGYVRGYVSSYARYLELDPVPLLAMYKAETGTGRAERLDLPQVAEAVAPRGEQHALPLRSAIIVVSVLAVLSLGIWGITRAFNGPEPTPPVPVAPTETVDASTEPTAVVPAESSEPTKTETKEQTSAETAKGETAPFTLKVVVDADGASWVRITVDGKPAYEGTLTGGQSKSFEVTEEATVRVGKPEAVTITRDGEAVSIENKGDVPTVTLKAEPAE